MIHCNCARILEQPPVTPEACSFLSHETVVTGFTENLKNFRYFIIVATIDFWYRID
jgi:hypothetical protein